MEEYYLMWLTRIDGIGLETCIVFWSISAAQKPFGVRNPLQFGGLQFWREADGGSAPFQRGRPTERLDY